MLFAFPPGLYALLVLIPFLIIYLRKPRLIEETVPSLMFFMNDPGSKHRFSFLRNFIRNLLFLLQLLLLVALALSIAQPYISVPATAASGETVIVIDASASMQARLDGSTRFAKAIETAGSYLSDTNSIVLAEHVPLIIEGRINRQKAADILAGIKPKETTTNLGDAIITAGDLIKTKGRVVVLSDFLTTDGPDVVVAKRALTAKGIDVKYISIGGNASNSGIISLSVEKALTKVSVKNYGQDRMQAVSLVQGNALVAKQSRLVSKGSIEMFAFNTTQGDSVIKLEPADDLAADNFAYVSVPEKRIASVLLISNSESSYLRTALSSLPDVSLRTAKPPVIASIDYDVIVLDKLSESLLLPGFYSSLKRQVGNGTSLIAIGNYGPELLPVRNIRKANSSDLTLLSGYQFTKDISFGTLGTYYPGDNLNATVIASDAKGAAVLAIRQIGSGKVFYYGIDDATAEFRLSPSYPIFWSQIIGYLSQTIDLKEFNTETGKLITLAGQSAMTPDGKFAGSKLLLDRAGFYNIGSKDIAVNLLSMQESDISAKAASDDSSFVVQTEQIIEQMSFELPLIAAAIGLLALELLFIKRRGDI